MAGNNKDWAILASRKTEYGVFHLLVDNDRLSAKMVGEAMQPTLTVLVLNALLADMGVCFGIREEGLVALAQAASEGRQRAEEIIAVGTPVVDGRDAYVEFHKRPVGAGGEGDIDAVKIDYREFHAFDSVKSGDLIATLHPPQEGQGGTDIFGKTIPTKKPRDLTILPGNNVVYDESTHKFTATASGYVAYERGKIEVRFVYIVRGDVDLTQGNIRFIGRVEVGRDVRDAFEIQAEQGIAINGTAEACFLRSGKDITIRGGVTGKGKGRIEAQEGLTTRFLDGVEVVCGGDVIVQKEIVNSKVYSLGRVIVRDGAIIGSEVVALRGILAREAGSGLGVKTTLIAGLDYKVRERLITVNKDLQRLRHRQETLLNRLGPLLLKAVKQAAPDPRQREEIEDLMAMVRQQQRQIERLEAESGDISRSFAETAIPCISIVARLYPGVTAVTGAYDQEFQGVLVGPLSLCEDHERHCLTTQSGLALERLWTRESKSGARAAGVNGKEGAKDA